MVWTVACLQQALQFRETETVHNSQNNPSQTACFSQDDRPQILRIEPPTISHPQLRAFGLRRRRQGLL